jgi:hypothetical protein
MSLPKGHESPSNNNSTGAGKNIAGVVIVLVLVLGGSLAVAMLWWDSATNTSGDSSKVDIESQGCDERNGKAHQRVLITNDNDYDIIVTWDLRTRDSSGTILSMVEGYANVPAGKAVMDENYATLHPSIKDCLPVITEVTRVP